VNTYFDLNVKPVMIPDVMNKVNVLESNGDISYHTVSETDSFPVFAGFPVHVSGVSFEGGIFCNMDSDPEVEIVFTTTFRFRQLTLTAQTYPAGQIRFTLSA
jgi:hypothetical protein